MSRFWVTESLREVVELDDLQCPVEREVAEARAERVWDWSDDLLGLARRQEGAARFATAPFRPHVRRVTVERRAA